ncbi:hypothetical protein FIV00_14815 [Labrenzia sp. THAF82]|uniref:hypothetical protein n=1 Tax=Labrenzia sp. THAF82 TaxID=2587861 RepID=UPI001268BE15|nr:hypothetical protein [Labrenzia sp. THAF82]QFT31762.1 hypothetical protein FIV00_14815 [Labrenzia sp. THAF82]
MTLYSPETTWIAILGGGFSGSILAGGSVFQFDLWNMGSKKLPIQVLVTGKRAGLMAEAGTAMAVLLVTGCRTAREMDGITSSGLDWELSFGGDADAVVKSGASVFKEVMKAAGKQTGEWALHESGKRLAQYIVGDLGVVQQGRQFNLLPTPISASIGAGIFYEWQKLHVLDGEIGWNYISPEYSVENRSGNVYMRMKNIPVKDGTTIHLGFGVDEWGIDGNIKWTPTSSGPRIGRSRLHIDCAVYGGELYQSFNRNEQPGINLSQLQPAGRSEAGMLTVSNTKEVAKNGKLTIYPRIFKFTNYPYWSADDTMTVHVDGKGRFTKVDGTTSFRD